MNKIAAVVAGLGLAAAVQADVPVFHNNVLSIEEAVVFTATGPKYYGDVRLQSNANGSLSIVAGELRALAQVDDADVEVDVTVIPAEAVLHVEGQLPTPCNALEEPGVYRNGATFHVVLAVDEPGPAETCIQKLEPFAIDIELPVQGLDAGTYKVLVNDVETSFTLDSDN